MKLRTLDESLGSKYGMDSSTSSREKIHIRFKNIEVREYGRTVGDNPSVSSGMNPSHFDCYEDAR